MLDNPSDLESNHFSSPKNPDDLPVSATYFSTKPINWLGVKPKDWLFGFDYKCKYWLSIKSLEIAQGILVTTFERLVS